MNVEVELQGIDDIISRMEELGVKANKAITNALKEGAVPILEDAKNTTVFKDRTGKLRQSLKKSKVKSTRYGKTIWVGDVDRECGYSWNVEYGNSKVPAKPFLRPAYEKNKQQAKEIIKERLREELRM